MTENQILNKLKKELKNHIEFFKIETGATELSIPDTYFRTYKSDGWIELKCAKKSNNILKIRFEPGQRNFLLKQKALGLNSFLLIYYNNKYYLINDLFKDFYINIVDLITSSCYVCSDFYNYGFIKALSRREK